jgi:SAM-dependent methyltransferase
MTGSLRDRCPACGSADLAAAFTRAEWAAAAPDDRRSTMAAMEADPGLAFGAFLRCGACGTYFTDRVPSPDTLGRFYGAYQGNPTYLAKLDKKLALETRRLFCLRFLVRGRRFLDVGSSIGCAVEAARRNGFAATGLELGEEAVAIARERFPRNEFIVGALGALPPDRRFDLVQCVEVIEHVPDVPLFVEQLAARVAPGGVLLLTTPDVGHRRVRGNEIGWGTLKPPEHITLFTRAGVRAALAPHFRRVVILPNAKPGVQALAFKEKS